MQIRSHRRAPRLSLTALALLIGSIGTVHARPAGTVVADVVALDQPYVYNRFGSFNPYGQVYALRRDVIDTRTGRTLDQPGVVASPCFVAMKPGKRPRPMVLRANVGDRLEVKFQNLLCPTASGVRTDQPGDRPATRIASMMFQGLTTDAAAGINGWDPRQTGIAGIEPGASITYRFTLERDGNYLFHDNGAPAGGEADAGSNVLGLYGSLNVEPAGANVYRSEVTKEVLDAAKAQAPAGSGALLNYEAVDTTGALTGTAGLPLLNMHRSLGAGRWEVIHSDLNAIVQDYAATESGFAPVNFNWFREFTVVLQDELKTMQAFGAAFDHTGVGIGVRDGFGINYGASGFGAILASNRLGVGPAKDCVECAYEEFFLTSWANGDPAMVLGTDGKQRFPDDPGNVHHSYSGDPVRFRTMQAGVKETHIFHLHAHQWFSKAGTPQANYLDSQTIGPRQAMNYPIAYTGGNRNRTIGDAIFHCHMYPHFAQGMWALWRIHDVFEDGSRRLPDGELGNGTDPMTGATAGGAFIPAVVPIRNRPLAPMPTYGENGLPGYPFFTPGKAGRRPPQPPLDLVQESLSPAEGGQGLGRHIVTGGTRTPNSAQPLVDHDWTVTINSAQLELLPSGGTALEKRAMAFHNNPAGGYPSLTPAGTPGTFPVNGRPGKPGAPFADPCPATAPLREYDVSAIQMNMVVNKQGWHDPQARLNVLTSEVAAYEGKKRTAEPFFFRVNSGECVVLKHTNRMPGTLELDAFQVRTPTDTVGKHIHLVKFDVLSADGSGNGWNYEDGTFAREALVERAHAAQAPGGSAKMRQDDGTLVDVTLPAAEAIPFQTTVQRWWADDLIGSKGEDRTLRTVFTHDHFAPSSIQQHGYYAGMVIEPKGSEWLRPDGSPLAGGVGTEALIRNTVDRVNNPDYREFMLASADFAVLYKPDGRPVDPPPKPELISAQHHNPYLVNYRMEAIPLRLSSNGERSGLYPETDPRRDHANIFSSRVHGDPFTPVFKAYEGDRVQFRLLHGAQEVQQTFHVHGLRWKRESGLPESPFVSTQELGISEHFEMEVARLPNVTGLAKSADHLFHYGSQDSLWNGMWGLLRVYADGNVRDAVTGQVAGNLLAGLQSNPITAGSLLGNLAAALGANGCPIGSPVRSYAVEVWAARDLLPGGTLVYNKRANITDPSALMYVLSTDVAGLRAGTLQPEPLVLRANAGDCVQVRMTNRLPADRPVPDLPGDAPMPTVTSLRVDDVKPSRRVSMHAQLMSYDVRQSDGANVGWNPEQTAGPGETRTYTWYAGEITWNRLNGVIQGGAPVEFGTVPIRAMSDVVKQGVQGLIGALIIQPAGASYWNEANTAQIQSGTRATIRVGSTSFKENVLFYQDGLNLRLPSGTGTMPIPQHYTGDDSYDLGERAVNYRSEPLWSRVNFANQGAGCPSALPTPTTGDPQVEEPLTEALQSIVSDDMNACVLGANLMVDNDARLPAAARGLPVETPIFTARAGEQVRFRVVQPEGRARQHSFRVLGHSYPDRGIDNYISPGNSLMATGKGITATLYGGAKRGYWLWKDGPAQFVSTGMWGLFKVQ